MAGPNGAVVRRAAGGPFVEEGFRRDRETVTTVRVANAQDGAGNGFGEIFLSVKLLKSQQAG